MCVQWSLIFANHPFGAVFGFCDSELQRLIWLIRFRLDHYSLDSDLCVFLFGGDFVLTHPCLSVFFISLVLHRG